MNDKSVIEQTQSQFVLINKANLFALLKDSDNLQETIDILDNSLIPVSKFNNGLSTKEDKAIIDYLAVNASDKVYVYSNQEQGLISPITRVVIADNEGLSIQYPTPNTARIGIDPFYESVETPSGVINAALGSKVISFANSDTVDVLVVDGKIQFDATKTKEYALAMSLIFGG